MKMYLVSGNTGEYSDYTSWVVKVFHDKNKAESLKNELNEWCRKNHCSIRGSILPRYDITCPLDPHFKCYYTGTEYIVEEAEGEI